MRAPPSTDAAIPPTIVARICAAQSILIVGMYHEQLCDGVLVEHMDHVFVANLTCALVE
jgi:hypothetical protein